MFKIIEEMTRAAAASSRKPGLRDMPCIVHHYLGRDGNLWISNTMNVLTIQSKAMVMSVGFAITSRNHISDDYVLCILESVPKPEDGRAWLTAEEFAGLPRGGNLDRLTCKIKNLNNKWHCDIGGKSTEEQAMAVPWGSVAETCCKTSLILVPGVSVEDFEKMKSGEEVRVKLCDVNRVLSIPLLQLIKESPENPSVRAMVRAAIRKKLPDEANTESSIREWIEFNVQEIKQQKQSTLSPAINPYFAAPQPAPSENAFSVELSVEDTEFGTCNYSNSRVGTYSSVIPKEKIMEWVEEGASIHTITERIREYADDDCSEAWGEGEVDMEESGEVSHDNYNQSDDSPSDRTIRISASQRQLIHDNLMSFLRNSDLTEEQRTIYGI